MPLRYPTKEWYLCNYCMGVAWHLVCHILYGWLMLHRKRSCGVRHMFQAIFPILPVLILCHAVMFIVMAETFTADADLATLPPEAYPV